MKNRYRVPTKDKTAELFAWKLQSLDKLWCPDYDARQHQQKTKTAFCPCIVDSLFEPKINEGVPKAFAFGTPSFSMYSLE
jgi:hypothetical protein